MDGDISGLTAVLRHFAIPFAVFAALAVAVKRRAIVDALWRCRQEATTNLLLLTINVLVMGPLFAIPVMAVEAVYAKPALLAALWGGLPEIIVLVAAIVLIDLVAYWRHRLEHSASLWRFHATHHSDTAIHWLTVHRKHPVAKLLSMLVDNAVVLLLGFPVWAVVGAMIVRTWWGYFIHADVPWTLGSFGKVLMSPAAHRLHHIRDEKLMGTNYGNTVTLWDRLFGTWCDPAPYVDCETGIAEGTRGFLGELIRPWERRYRAPDRPSVSEQPAV